MVQVTQRVVSATPTYVTPIKCPYCSAKAHLARRFEAVTGDGKGEIRSFECELCQQQIDMFVRP